MLRIDDLSYHYPGAVRAALDNVSLTVAPGEVLGLLGPNGAGKTTLMTHLAGQARLQHGSIRIGDAPLGELRRRDPTRVTIAPQDYAFYPMLTVLENLRCFAGTYRISAGSARAEAVERCLSLAQLHDWRDVRAEQLSGGLKRRLNLAIALLPSPDLLLLDEPTVGVDPQSRAFLLDVVKALARQGTAVVYTTHYMEEVEAIADRVAILDHGRVLRCGTLDELLRDGTQRLELTVEPDSVDATHDRLREFGSVLWRGARASVDLSPGYTPLQVLQRLMQDDLAVEQVAYGRATLEHLFMRLTRRSLRD